MWNKHCTNCIFQTFVGSLLLNHCYGLSEEQLKLSMVVQSMQDIIYEHFHLHFLVLANH